MERGKEVCRMLKEIRRQIAKENDIAFVTEECKHKGDCAGTCPKCESEVQYLERQLERRRRLGYTTRVAGLALGLAAISPAFFTSCDPQLDGDLDIERLQGDISTEPVTGLVAPDYGQDKDEGQNQDEGQGQGEGENQEEGQGENQGQ